LGGCCFGESNAQTNIVKEIKMKSRLICAIALLSLLIVAVATAPQITPTAKQSPANTPNLAIGNPAAIYCAEIMGYEYKIITDSDGGQRGICKLPNTQECDQWDFYAGTCGQDYDYCAQQGYHTETRTDGQDPFASSYAVCISPEAQVLGSVTQLSDLNARAADIQAEECPDIDTHTPPPASVPHDVVPAAPSSFDWRNYQDVNWLTSVKNQSSCGSCWAFAAVGVAETHHNIVKNNPNLDLNLAEQDLVSCSSAGSCSGGSSSAALRYIRDNGSVDENCMPYTASDSNCNRCSDWQSRLTYVDEVYSFIPSRSTIRQSVVDYSPIYIYMGIGSEYGGYFDGSGVYRCTNNSGINHAVMIVGYNDTGSYWIVKNSWGASWNGNGYFKVGYGECAIDSTYAGYTYSVPPTKASNIRPDDWSGAYTNDTTPRFQWNAASDTGSGMAGYYVAVDDWTPEGGYGNDWWVGNVTAFTVPDALADGQHIFAVTSKDRFGNVNPTNTNQQGDAPYYTFYVDTQSPSSAVNTLAAEQDQSRFNVRWSGSDATSGVTSYDVQYRYGLTGNWIAWINASSAASAIFHATQEGDYYFRSRAYDRASNVESWPSGDGDTHTYVRANKIYLPLVLKNYDPCRVACYPDLPSPHIALKSIEQRDNGKEYWLEVTNSSSFPDKLFEPAPHLPPCGLNPNASRTWLEIYDGNGNYIYGYCAFSSAADLQSFRFFVQNGTAPPPSVYITLRDRECDITYTSNSISP